MQTSYNSEMSAAFKGLLADSTVKFSASLKAMEQVGLGLGLAKFKGKDNACRLPIADLAGGTASADLSSSNSTVVTITVTKFGGQAVTTSTSATVYATSHAATMAAIAAKVAAIDGIASCTVTGGANRTLTITAEDNVALSGLTITTTGGSAVTWSYTYDTNDSLYAISFAEAGLEQAGLEDGLIDKVEIEFSTNLITGNVAAGYINGTAISVTYATSHANTMALLQAAIEAVAGVAYVEVSGNVLTIHADPGYSLRAKSWAVTGGASQPTTTVTSTDTSSGGEVYYAATEPVNGLRKGRVYVQVEEAVDSDDTVYWRFMANGTGKTPGQFRKSDDSGTAVAVAGAVFVTSAAANGFAVVEINLP